MVPGGGAPPFTRKVDAAAGVSLSLPTSGIQSSAIFSATGNPFSASPIAGCEQLGELHRAVFVQERGPGLHGPGTVIDAMPVVGMRVMFFDEK